MALKSFIKFIIFLDYDGTLVPIVEDFRKAGLSAKDRKIIKTLAQNNSFEVIIVSGRSLADVRSLVNLSQIGYIGNHGFEVSGHGFKFVHPKVGPFRKLLKKVLKKIELKLPFYGVEVEDKKLTASLHYRKVAASLQGKVKALATEVLSPHVKNKEIVVTYGKKVIELRPPINWNKGHAVLWILKKLKDKKMLPIYIGDDSTDEDSFHALREKGLTFYVGKKRKTLAKYRLKNIKAVYRFLRWLNK
ncbi:trehalose-phosphatase [candidate division WOR-1 bacterium RIFOXYD2_FULL_36_8]|uniref:Trehalose 6-phosphate phosphatase n=1 Tax=candidate division WOR-1 bacterium RIFOXYB2_FULL_36_35 TaxID=1802578 RepID=A0A1F4S311_UNCSA|nr:MAG: trehalose-phosphatase [candidate division WOR-1 bacterium RIFOXYA2_FULL_36_21]OGC14798.1 MAG: trehalose-phosphatase [candidate division WOR-1 bacterium RIFOXYB2_FULL_36_35]OGC16566.1 MAG: trehalose-phosphatase [candidate division WOR-1 bacterium RIFOXYA12_FULL_36_13]OGC37728.1 MAG: trehalose-phosphatase [candidate division WOR-1 bacterium RIFOXYD2_FULL_36_8]